MNPELKNAFRFHMRNNRPAIYYAQGYKGRNAWVEKANGIAREALERARQDVDSGKTRYPAPIKGHAMRGGYDSDKPGSIYIENPESFGLRHVGDVIAEMRRGNIWGDDSGWYSDCDQCETIKGAVYQMPSRKGCAIFVAGYRDSHNPSAVLLDFGTLYRGARDDNDSYDGARGNDAARDAARAADSMAESAAETERKYQTAWRAGSDYAQEGETITEARQEALAILQERRKVKGAGNYPALCAAIRAQVQSLLSDIASARAKRAELASGDAPELYFWTGDKDLQSAFCEGAGLESFPA